MPTKDDYLAQVDADLKVDGADKATLKARRKRVAAAKTDAAARDAYFAHLAETQREDGVRLARLAHE